MSHPVLFNEFLRVKKDKADVCDDVVAAVERNAKVACCLHDKNAVALNRGKTLVRMAAGLTWISAFIAEHAAGGQSQNNWVFIITKKGRAS